MVRTPRRQECWIWGAATGRERGVGSVAAMTGCLFQLWTSQCQLKLAKEAGIRSVGMAAGVAYQLLCVGGWVGGVGWLCPADVVWCRREVSRRGSERLKVFDRADPALASSAAARVIAASTIIPSNAFLLPSFHSAAECQPDSCVKEKRSQFFTAPSV
ncbi:hypothetical protein P280DRAFT_93847 [Massarina eburnea CBS 473.64]|uniref:Uncharacterized protein n=1 Tax=Massarina eburnea CBS 473.64 TaxID=1395130 RepID=A0A6A6RQM0_9PLEO|nr:hypothetical protein P280DRAFT_93847 [Massarina eburnea CBS 473.64]